MSKIDRGSEYYLYSVLLDPQLNIATTLIHDRDGDMIGGGPRRPVVTINSCWMSIEEWFKSLGSSIEY